MNNSYLTLTLHFSSAVCLVMGVLLWVEARDNRARRLLGISTTIFGFFFLIRIFMQERGVVFEGILPTGNLAGGCLAAFLLSLYPLEVIRPGWLTQRKFIQMLLPWLLLVGGVIVCAVMGMGETVVPSVATIPRLLGHVDVWFRLAFLVLILGYTLLNYSLPLLWKKLNPEAFRWLHGFILGILAVYVSYLLSMFTMAVNWDAIHKVVVFSFVFYIGYKALFHENPSRGATSPQPAVRPREGVPASRPPVVPEAEVCPAELSPVAPADSPSEEPKPEEEATESELWMRILACMDDEAPWMDADFLLPSLSSRVNSNRTSVSVEIRRHGFSSFNEFVSRYRISNFKRQMEAYPGIPGREAVTDAWQSCGYRSYITFYRNFSDIEGLTPAEYLKNKP